MGPVTDAPTIQCSKNRSSVHSMASLDSNVARLGFTDVVVGSPSCGAHGNFRNMSHRPATALALLLAGVLGCPPKPEPTPDAGPTEVPDAGLYYAEDCPPGSMPVAGLSNCQSVGWVDCPAGFEPHPSGWGCLDVLPTLPCEGATRESLGSRACLPMGDCTQAFPPPNATHFVDPAGPVDATHFKTITGALAAAPDGAVVAIDRGTYPEQLALRKSVSLVGRCPEQVILNPSGQGQAGLRFVGVPVRVEASGFTVRGFEVGASVDGASTLVLQSMLFDANLEVGLFATERSTLRATATVIRNTQSVPSGPSGMGVYVDDGVRVELYDSAIVGNAAAGVYLAAPPGSSPNSARIESTVVSGTRATPFATGEGLLFDRAVAQVTRSAIVGNHTIGVRVDNATANVTLTESVVRDTGFANPPGNASGAQVQRGARLEVLRSSFIGNGGAGVAGLSANTQLVVRESVVQGTKAKPTNGLAAALGVSAGARLELADSVSVSNQVVGFYVSGPGSFATILRSLVLDTQPNERGGYGRGLEVSFDAGVSATRLAILTSRTHGLLVVDSVFSGSEVIVDGVRGQAVAPPLPAFGDGVAASRATVQLVRPIIRHATGIGALYSAATGSIDDGVIADNVIGIHFQKGTSPREVSAVEPVMPLTVVLTTSTRFVQNSTKVGSGEFALPEVTRQ